MLLAIDIGNTNIVIGGIKNDKFVFEARLATDKKKTSDQYGTELKELLSIYDIEEKSITGCIIVSVVPPVLQSVNEGLRKALKFKPLIVGPGIKTGLNIKTDNPAQVGADRIVAAVGALENYKAPLILLDLGTASTIEVVDKNNNYVGGCIIPGARISLDALTSRTAQLPAISLEKPKRVIGKNTVECMQSGIMYGTASMVDGMIDRVEEELSDSATVIATGGIAKVIVPLCKHKIILEDELLLTGLNSIYKRNQK